MFIVDWSSYWAGKEFLETEWFQVGTKGRTEIHKIKYRKSNRYKGPCTIDVEKHRASKGKYVAMLDYERTENNKFNKKYGCDTGIARLTFADKTFSSIEKYEWKPEGSDEFFEPEIEITTHDAGFDYLTAEAEGQRRIVAHMISERSYQLRKLKLDQAAMTNENIRCELCAFSFKEKYGEIGLDFCEVHHSKPLKYGTRITKLSCLNILCSNCHRMIHRTGSLPGRKGSMMLVPEFADYLMQTGAAKGWQKRPTTR